MDNQGIYAAFGGKLCYTKPTHGKITTIFHNGTHIFENIPNPIKATRYNSIACDPLQRPQEIEIIAWSADGIIMAIKHRKYPIYWLTIPPKSIGTAYGKSNTQKLPPKWVNPKNDTQKNNHRKKERNLQNQN